MLTFATYGCDDTVQLNVPGRRMYPMQDLRVLPTVVDRFAYDGALTIGASRPCQTYAIPLARSPGLHAFHACRQHAIASYFAI
jgi:hypothetical protein